jgi:ADP-heptose:LPS heptosyltransferase
VRVLVVRAGALGDTLLLRPVVASLHIAGDSVSLLAPEGSGSALVGPGLAEVDDLVPWERAEVASLLSGEDLPEGPLRQQLASHELAIAYTRSAELVRALRALTPEVLVHDPAPPAGSGHASRWLLEPLRRLAYADPGPLPATMPGSAESDAAAAFARDLPERFLAIHPGSGSAAKNWPADRFAALVATVSAGRRFLLVEGPADRAAAAPLRALEGAVLADTLPPRILGAVLARAGVYVGTDSGVSHLAAAWGATVVALFGPTDPLVWAPLGSRVRIVSSATGSMDGITLEAVLASLNAER